MSNTSLAQAQPQPAAAQPVTNAEKARALIAMLEPGNAAPAGVPPERLRDWASDLIRTVEGGKGPAADVPAPRRRRLFTKAPPKLTPEPAAEPARVRVESQPSRLTLTAPMPHTPAGPTASAHPSSPSAYSAEDVRKIIDATIDPATLAREHPAIIAMTLLGKPSMEQAGALRNLPGGQVRAVHKALRQMEFNRVPAPPSEARVVPISG